MSCKGEILYEKIKSDIIKGRYKPSEIINEGKIASEYGFSKTPARDALFMLSEQGYVVKHARVGYSIKQMSMEESYKQMHLRYIIESGILKYVIAVCTDEEIAGLYKYTQNKASEIHDYNEQNKQFHIELAKLTKNEFIVKTLSNLLNANMQWTSLIFFNRESTDLHARHKQLIMLLLNRSVDKVIEWEKKEMTWADEKPPHFIDY